MKAKSILIVDDDSNLRKTLSDILRVKGYTPITAETGKTALDRIEEELPAVVLIDLRLGDISGLTVLEAIKKKASHVECIVLTGYSSQTSAIEAINLGAYGYMQKPYNIEQLLLTVQRAIEKQEAEQALQENQERYLRAVLAAKTGVWDYDIETGKVFFDEGLKTLFGLEVSESKIDNYELIFSFLPAQDQKEVGQEFQRIVEGFNDEYSAEHRLVRQDDSVCWIAVNGKVIQDAMGKRLRIIGTITDITARKQVEEVLQDNIQELNIAYQQAKVYAQDLNKEILERKRVEKALRDAHDELEIRVLERTMDLSKANESLQSEIEQRLRMEEALRKSEERYALAARGANDGLWDWNLQTDLVYYSPRWKSMLGYKEHEIGSSLDEWFNRVHPEDLEILKTAITAHCNGDISHFEHEHRMLHKDGAFRWILSRGLAVRNSDGQAYRMAGSQTDITERKEAEAKLLHDALYDGLTGLSNRAFFMDKVNYSIKLAKELEDYLFAVLFLDLDRFKIVNDSLGHLVGDELLIAVAYRLTTCLRLTDTVARFGGDEFAILLDSIEGIDEAVEVANHIQQEIALPFEVSGHTAFTTVSIGIAPSTIGYDQPEDCLRDADTAMYHAKANGRARYEIFSRDMHTSAMSLWLLEADFRRAVERQEFQIHYQPIVSLASGQITGAEALLRWRHPQRGLLEPAEFMPLAEETGLIVPMGEWGLHQVCAQAKGWQAIRDFPLSVAVNLSARQFQHQNVPGLIETILGEAGLSPEALVVEITESIATKNLDTSLAALHELSAMGIRISIDDFGIGSALDCLKRLPLNSMKIDQSFIRDIIRDADNAAITKAIIEIAHSLNLTVVAEGVETKEQLAFLRAHQCDQVQGYLFSQPMPAKAFTDLLQQGWHMTVDEGIVTSCPTLGSE